MDFTRKRWISLVAAMSCALQAGLLYSWSVFVLPLSTKYGWTPSSVSIAYTLNVVAMALVPIVCGKLRARMPIRQYCLVGSAIYCSGTILCGFMLSSVYELYVYFGIMVGAGNGFIYLSLASYVVQLFPDKKGFAAGLYTSSYGCGALFWAPAAGYIIQATGDVSNAFIYLGILFSVGLVISTRFLHEVPQGYEGEARRTASDKAEPLREPARDVSPKELLRSPVYYLVVSLYTFGLIGGMMVLALGSPIVQAVLSYTPEQAALIVGLFAVASSGGRLVWGWISDILGRTVVLLLLGLITCCCMLVLASADAEAVFLAALLAIPMCYGAYAATLPPVAVETFGAKYFSMNYNFLFIAFGMAALVGPQVVAYAQSASGEFEGAFLYGTAFGAASSIAALIFLIVARSQHQEDKSRCH